jgi:lysyl-tRNA synthetase class II
MSEHKAREVNRAGAPALQAEEDLNELMRVRREKLSEMREKGIEPYGGRFERTHAARDILDRFEELENKPVVIAGRIMSRRGMGKALLFLNIIRRWPCFVKAIRHPFI